MLGQVFSDFHIRANSLQIKSYGEQWSLVLPLCPLIQNFVAFCVFVHNIGATFFQKNIDLVTARSH